jgi:uncharacterized protein YggU (UPF0235/DUF167 family)
MQKKIKVKPNSKQQKIEEQPDGSLTVYLKSPPVDGKANEEQSRAPFKSLKRPIYALWEKTGLPHHETASPRCLAV